MDERQRTDDESDARRRLLFHRVADIETLQRKLQESDELYQIIFHQTRDILYTVLPDGRIATLNPAFETITGWRKCEWINRHFEALIHPDNLLLANRMFQMCLMGKTVPLFELQILTRWGHYKPLEFNVVPRKEADIVAGVIGAARDITEKRTTQNQQKKLEPFIKSTIDALAINLCVIDRKGTIIGVNKSWRDFATVNPPVIPHFGLGANYLEVCDKASGLYAEEAAEFASGIRSVSSGDRNEFAMEYPCHSPTVKRWYLGVVTPFPDRKTQLLAVAHEPVTSLKLVQEEMEKLNQALENREREKSLELQRAYHELEDFCYSVSHDLRAPLRTINGFSEILIEEYRDRFDQRGLDYFQRIQCASVKMSNMIDDLLEMYRISRQDIHFVPTDLSYIAQSILTGFKELDPRREVEVFVQPDVIAKGDKKMLRTALELLLNNAWKFTSQKPQATIEFGTVSAKGKPVYFVRDNGAGFDMAYADKLFRVFQRLHGPSEFEGIGIGLAIVERIIKRHGGNIWAEGKIDQGATFYFTLDSQ